MKRLNLLHALILLPALMLPTLVNAYPVDGYPETGIRRLESVRLIEEGVIRGRKQPRGALLPTADVELRLLNHRDLEMPAPDPEFTKQVVRLLGENAERYGVAVLDLSNPEQPRYAEHRGDFRQNVGSVGKLVAALGLFQALADTWPDDLDKRRDILRNTIVTADDFCKGDHHKIRIFDVEAQKLHRRAMHPGDTGRLYEFLDWMLSASANSAASMVMREAMLLAHYGKEYPVSNVVATEFFKNASRDQLTALFQRVFFNAITRNGLDLALLRQGSFFTRTGKHKVPGGGNSYGTARELMKYMLRMEQGRLVDEFSSRAIKRLLYITERRIRYASAPALYKSAVYFKSGSLYSCVKEEGFKCRKYMGNKKNYMNSVAGIETPAGENRLFYITTLISNVLRKNSAVDHQTLATRIHRLIEKANPAPPPPPPAKVTAPAPPAAATAPPPATQ